MSVKLVVGVLVAAVLLLSCGERRSKQQLATINRGFSRADRFIRETNVNLYLELQNREFDPYTAAYALPWASALKKIRSLTDDLDFYLDSIGSTLKGGGKLSEGSQIVVSARLQEYKSALLTAFDSVLSTRSTYIKKAFSEMGPKLPLSKDSEIYKENPPITLELLNKLRIDVQLSENELLRFCKTESIEVILDLGRMGPVISVNSTHFKAGESMEIHSGIGTFDLRFNPRVTVRGRSVPINRATGMADDTVSVGDKPGKYKIRVKMEFINPDGSPVTVYKDVSYTVDPAR